MPRRRSNRAQSGCCERGQASLLMLAVVGALLAVAAVLFAFGNALGAKGRTSGLPTWRRSAPRR